MVLGVIAFVLWRRWAYWWRPRVLLGVDWARDVGLACGHRVVFEKGVWDCLVFVVGLYRDVCVIF